MQKYLPLILCFLSGVFYAFGYPGNLFPQFFILPIIGFGVFQFYKDKTNCLKRKLLMVFFLALGLTLAGFYWIPYTVNEFGGVFPPFNYLLSVLFCLIVVPQYFVYVLLDHYAAKKLSKRTLMILREPSIMAFILVVLETYTPQQFPAHLGHPWMQISPYIGLAPILGAIGFSYFSYLIAFEGVSFLRTKKMNLVSSIAIAIFIIANVTLKLERPTENIEKINVRMVQANIGSLMKVSSEAGIMSVVRSVLQTYDELTQLPSDKDIDLVIWPETAYPNQVQSKMIKENSRFIPRSFIRASKDLKADFFTGGYDTRKNSGDYYFESEYNAAFFIKRDGSFGDVYHKRKLIPFGEGLPFGPLNKIFSKIITNITYFAQGERFTLFQTSDGHYFSTAICYEILFSSFIRDYLNDTKHQPSFLINITNDSWYGPTSEPHQHLFLSKWRAVENAIPIIRMTNTGISSILYEDGSESKRTGVFTKEILDVELSFSKTRIATIFQKIGILTTAMISILIFVISYYSRKEKIKI